MLMGFMPMGGMIRGTASVSYAGLTNSSDLTSPSLTVPIGAAGSDRYVIAVVFADNSATSSAVLTSMTIGGVACTKVTATADNNRLALAIFVTNTPIAAGTTETLVLTGSADNSLGFATYAAYGINPAVVDTATADANDPSSTIDVPSSGFIIAASINDSDANSCTWTGVTEDFDTAFTTSVKASGGVYRASSSETNRTVTANWSTSDNDKLLAASWGPA